MGTKHLVLIGPWYHYRSTTRQSIQFGRELLEKIADLKSFRTLKTTITPNLIEQMKLILQNGYITELDICCMCTGKNNIEFDELCGAIAKSKINKLRISGDHLFSPRKFAQAIRDSWITTLELSYVYGMPDDALSSLAEKLEASAVTMMQLPDVNLISHDKTIASILTHNLTNLKAALELSLPGEFISPLKDIVAEYLYLPSQPFVRTKSIKDEEAAPSSNSTPTTKK